MLDRWYHDSAWADAAEGLGYKPGAVVSGRLLYDSDADRYQVIDQAGDVLHPGLHCGQCFAVLLPDGWTDSRIEYGADGWYLVGTPFVGRLDNVQVKGVL